METLWRPDPRRMWACLNRPRQNYTPRMATYLPKVGSDHGDVAATLMLRTMGSLPGQANLMEGWLPRASGGPPPPLSRNLLERPFPSTRHSGGPVSRVGRRRRRCQAGARNGSRLGIPRGEMEGRGMQSSPSAGLPDHSFLGRESAGRRYHLGILGPRPGCIRLRNPLRKKGESAPLVGYCCVGRLLAAEGSSPLSSVQTKSCVPGPP